MTRGPSLDPHDKRLAVDEPADEVEAEKLAKAAKAKVVRTLAAEGAVVVGRDHIGLPLQVIPRK